MKERIQFKILGSLILLVITLSACKTKEMGVTQKKVDINLFCNEWNKTNIFIDGNKKNLNDCDRNAVLQINCDQTFTEHQAQDDDCDEGDHGTWNYNAKEKELTIFSTQDGQMVVKVEHLSENSIILGYMDEEYKIQIEYQSVSKSND